MPILFLTIWVLLLQIYIKKDSNRIYNPFIWLIIGWTLSFGLYLFSGIEYNHALSLKAGIYYWMVLICINIGALIGQKIRVKNNIQKYLFFKRVDSFSNKTYYAYIAIVCLGSLMWVFDIFRLNSISFNLHSDINQTKIGTVGKCLSTLGLIIWLYECINCIIDNKKFRFSALVGAFCYLIPALISSGRQSILIISISTIICLYYSFSKNKKYKYRIYLRIPIILAVVFLFIYITLIAAYRTPVKNKVQLFNYIYNSSLNESTSELIDKLGIFRIFFTDFLYYYSHELSMFQVLFDYYEGPKFWGMSQLTVLARNIPTGNGSTIFDNMWVYFDQMSAEAGVYSHVWRSAAGNCFVDFGVMGGLIYAIICGFFISRFYKKCIRTESVYNMVGLSLLCTGMLFSVQFSPIGEDYWLYPFIWWLLLPILENLLRREKVPL